jgi:integrase
MPRRAKELTALDVRRLTHPGGLERPVIHSVGGVAGLCLQITPTGGQSWLLRITVGIKRRELGLGSYPEVSLAAARDKAREAREQVRQGIDPIEYKRAQRAALQAAQRRGLTFEMAVEKYLAAKMDQFSSTKHQAAWASTLRSYAVPVLGEMLVDAIEVRDVLQVLQPMWMAKTSTASRLRGRIEAVLSWATVAGHRLGDNPARWKGSLKELLPAPAKITKIVNQPALQLDDAPRWFANLREREGMAYRALAFLALTAARSGEVRGATWAEIDIDNGLWSVPAARMKMDREHRVPLPTEALALLRDMPRFEGSAMIFPDARGGEMTDVILSGAMKQVHWAAPAPGYLDRASKRPAVPHGLRSTFRDWIAERTHFDGAMAEVALAHKVGNTVEAAYRRGDMVEKRRAMMQAWADYLASNPASKVVQLHGA